MTETHFYVGRDGKVLQLIDEQWVETNLMPGVEQAPAYSRKDTSMRFTHIWFRWVRKYPMPLKEKIERTKDLWSMNLADYLPKRVSYWIAMRQIGKATMTSQNVPATSLDNVLTNLGNVKDDKPLEQFQWTEPKGPYSISDEVLETPVRIPGEQIVGKNGGPL